MINKHLHAFARVSVALGCGLVAATAHAQSSPWTLKLGVIYVAPDVDSGNLSAPSLPNTKIDVKAATTVMLGLNYAIDDHWAIDAVLGWPPRHEIVGDGAIAGSGKLGSVVQIAPTVLGQYRFMDAGSALRPYVGLGLTYAMFSGGRGTPALTALTNPGGTQTTPSTDSAFGASLQLGASYAIDRRWSVDLSAMKTFIKTKNHLSTGQTIDTRLDPLSVALAVGYRF